MQAPAILAAEECRGVPRSAELRLRGGGRLEDVTSRTTSSYLLHDLLYACGLACLAVPKKANRHCRTHPCFGWA